MIKAASALALGLLLGSAAAAVAQPQGRGPAETRVAELLRRIEALDRRGPQLKSVLAVNPDALAQARRADDRAARARMTPTAARLNGLPVLVKDNVETADPLPTTAGSLALARNLSRRDAPFVARLREAGVVILGKTNLSEWANMRSTHSISGWSAVGGLTRNPHVLDRNACGSSSGSGAAVAAGLAPAAIGTETDGSITCPAAMNGIVGLKPTVGLVSRTHVVPISHSQDTAGPMTRTVEDAAALLTAMAGSDPADPATREADARKSDYLATLRPDALRGARLGVLKAATGYSPETDAVFARAVAALKAAGAVVVEIEDKPDKAIDDAELTVLLTELKADLNAYLASTDPRLVKSRTLADLIAFNRASARELVVFDQDLFEKAQATKGLTDPDYLKARATSLRLAGREGIDRMLARYGVQALIAPTTAPSWRTDVVNGDHFSGSVSTLPAVAGYPHLTVPMGAVRGLPVGLSFIGPAWSEARLLAYGYAFEQATHARVEPRFAPTVDVGPELEPLR